MKIIHNKKPMYFRPNGKTFGESDVPFAITVLVKYVTDVFNRFTICSFWIDDGIIVASNTNDKNWISEAETVRQFTVWMFSNLCLKMNEKCDLTPSFEKPWVGCFNSANFVYTKAAKILKLANIFLEIIKSGVIKFGQAEQLQGKISHLCSQNSRDPSLKIMKSIFTTVVRLFNEDPTKSKKTDTFYVSQGFVDWCIKFLNKMSSHLHLKSLDPKFVPEKRVVVACDASNVGSGLAIYHLDKLIFETAKPLPTSHILQSNIATLESASTDTERLTFLELALKDASKALAQLFPDSDFLVDIRTDSLPLVYQSMCSRLKTPLILHDMSKIFDFLQDWGVHYTINHHPRDAIFATKADANSRIYFPELKIASFRILSNFTHKRNFEKIDITRLLLHTEAYLKSISYKVIFVPMNLSSTLYAKILPKLLQLDTRKANFLFMPKLKNIVSPFYKKFHLRYEFAGSHFINKFPELHSIQLLPYVLFEVFGTTATPAPRTSWFLNQTRLAQLGTLHPAWQRQIKDEVKLDKIGVSSMSATRFEATRVNNFSFNQHHN